MNWDYAQLAHTAKEFGGPQGLIDTIYEDGLLDGYIDGGFKGIALGVLGTLSIGGIAILLKRMYDDHKIKAIEAKAALKQAITDMCEADEAGQSQCIQ